MSIVRRWPVTAFFLLACGISWPLAALSMVDRPGLPPTLVTFAEYLAKFGPSLAGLAVLAALEGKAGLRAMFRSLVDWRQKAHWYAVALLLPGTLWLAAVGVHRLSGGDALVWSWAGPWVFAGLVGKHFFLGGGLGEEIGWRWFMLRRLHSRHSALSAAMLVGVLWGLWHAPKLVAGENGNTANLALFTSYTVVLSIIFAAVFSSSGGSLFVAALFHAAMNATNGYIAVLIPNLSEAFPNNVIVFGFCCLILAGGLVAVLGPRRLAPKSAGGPDRREGAASGALGMQEG